MGPREAAKASEESAPETSCPAAWLSAHTGLRPLEASPPLRSSIRPARERGGTRKVEGPREHNPGSTTPGLPSQTERGCCRPRAAQQTAWASQASVWVPPAAGSWAPGAPEGPQGPWPQGALLHPLHPHPHPRLRASGLLERCLGRGVRDLSAQKSLKARQQVGAAPLGPRGRPPSRPHLPTQRTGQGVLRSPCHAAVSQLLSFLNAAICVCPEKRPGDGQTGSRTHRGKAWPGRTGPALRRHCSPCLPRTGVVGQAGWAC